MELEIGKHCAEADCKLLDFLPVKCFFCKQSYCKEHAKSLSPSQMKTGEGHHCNSHPVDARTILCPICDVIIPKNGNVDPNDLVFLHIQNGCQKPKQVKIYSNNCNHKGCLKKELVPIKCNACELTFCIKHRLGN